LMIVTWMLSHKGYPYFFSGRCVQNFWPQSKMLHTIPCYQMSDFCVNKYGWKRLPYMGFECNDV